MGQGSAATVREIEEIRDRIDSNMRELERRVPQPAVWAKRLLGVAVGTGVGLLVLRAVLRRRKSKAVLDGDGWVLVRAADLTNVKGIRRVDLKR
jgi:hypothetical protein